MSGLMRHKRSRQVAIGIGAAVAALAVIVAFALVWRATAPKRVSSPPPPAIEEAEPTTESVSPSESVIAALPATTTIEGTLPPSPSLSPTSPATPVTPGAPGALIAYRLGPNLYVADEGGQNANAVALAPTGDYSLSPDSRTIAVVDGDTKQLVFLDIASRTLLESNVFATARPVWMPDSSGVLVPVVADANGATRIQRVPRQGSGPTAVAMGGMVAVSPDAGTIVVGPSAASPPEEMNRVTVLRGARRPGCRRPASSPRWRLRTTRCTSARWVTRAPECGASLPAAALRRPCCRSRPVSPT